MMSIDPYIFHMKLNLVNLVKGHQQNLSNNFKYRGSRQQSSLHQIRKTIDFMLPLPKKDFTLHAQQVDVRLCFFCFFARRVVNVRYHILSYAFCGIQ